MNICVNLNTKIDRTLTELNALSKWELVNLVLCLQEEIKGICHKLLDITKELGSSREEVVRLAASCVELGRNETVSRQIETALRETVKRHESGEDKLRERIQELSNEVETMWRENNALRENCQSLATSNTLLERDRKSAVKRLDEVQAEAMKQAQLLADWKKELRSTKELLAAACQARDMHFEHKIEMNERISSLNQELTRRRRRSTCCPPRSTS